MMNETGIRGPQELRTVETQNFENKTRQSGGLKREADNKNEKIAALPGVVSAKVFEFDSGEKAREDEEFLALAPVELTDAQETVKKFDRDFHLKWEKFIPQSYLNNAGKVVQEHELTEDEKIKHGVLIPVYEKRGFFKKKDVIVEYKEKNKPTEAEVREYEAERKKFLDDRLVLENEAGAISSKIREINRRKNFREKLIPEFFSPDRIRRRTEKLAEFNKYLGDALQFKDNEVIAVEGDGGSYLTKSGNFLTLDFGFTEADRKSIMSTAPGGDGPAGHIKRNSLPIEVTDPEEGTVTKYLYVHFGPIKPTEYNTAAMKPPRIKAKVILKDNKVISSEIY
ncbi:MAG TPA: hypothetical protein VEA59_06490 [Patescibacteria group bacterium]|nr:hypothetical protein [Patescibacteria group bacterium]